jgi:hypothetical protein
MWLGGALGIAVFSAIATSRTDDRLANGASPTAALTSGFRVALLAAAISLAVAGILAVRSRNATASDVMGEVSDPGPGTAVIEIATAEA